jgi:hypothetical protein
VAAKHDFTHRKDRAVEHTLCRLPIGGSLVPPRGAPSGYVHGPRACAPRSLRVRVSTKSREAERASNGGVETGGRGKHAPAAGRTVGAVVVRPGSTVCVRSHSHRCHVRVFVSPDRVRGWVISYRSNNTVWRVLYCSFSRKYETYRTHPILSHHGGSNCHAPGLWAIILLSSRI